MPVVDTRGSSLVVKLAALAPQSKVPVNSVIDVTSVA
jgi:hypothetical protein